MRHISRLTMSVRFAWWYRPAQRLLLLALRTGFVPREAMVRLIRGARGGCRIVLPVFPSRA